jgi:hypothetical protein
MKWSKCMATKAASKSTKSAKADANAIPTEAQLLKMPESEYMNAQQLAFFKERLRTLEAEILSNAGATTEHLRETVLVPDPADRATIEEEIGACANHTSHKKSPSFSPFPKSFLTPAFQTVELIFFLGSPNWGDTERDGCSARTHTDGCDARNFVII